jgi:hypothetical protein
MLPCAAHDGGARLDAASGRRHDRPIDYCYAQGWTDGRPVVPPTEARVQAMLTGAGRAQAEKALADIVSVLTGR